MLEESELKYSHLLSENDVLMGTVEQLTNEKTELTKRLEAAQNKVAELKLINKELQSPPLVVPEEQNELYLEKLNKGIDKATKKMDENDTVELRTLVEGLKEYAEETSIEEAHQLFLVFCMLLSDVPAWTKNVKPLRKFFADLKKKKKTGVNIYGNCGQVIETVNGNVNTHEKKGGDDGNND